MKITETGLHIIVKNTYHLNDIIRVKEKIMSYNANDPNQNRYWNQQVIRSLQEQIYEIEQRMRTDPDRYDRSRYADIIRKLNEAIYALQEEESLVADEAAKEQQ
ncbi:MAG: hypothetical protein UR87_C0040G0004 [candidate division CPR3 bacterium GW2011_GWE2_35_7]|uniref:Uncharacterized protein n=1 Tax=candidate division CPR3 bacterium GW2011_GWF2_35_18 TaxID=1618350 RepID=A0A0G0E3M1_UNCC3|nr:MAG: hypothetical protein UR67_C0002G0035 [candidate division CPR3 bacterium GW2011_GWF2_35_18]KKP85711.1 MAG: hypothetical protein UR87_C0040G0004 [candidate division CPR3 bacterium GW2011_GWE2_35_7]